MSRFWTARKTSTLDEGAIDSKPFEKAYPLFRTEMNAAAHRQALRLLAIYILMWLPMHSLIAWVWGRAPGLALVIVTVTMVATLIIAIAKWLGLTELLHHLPLVVVLGIVILAVGYLGTQPGVVQTPGSEFFGTIVVVIVIASIVSTLYKPLVSGYQMITLRTATSTLLAAGSATMCSLGIASVSQVVPWFVWTLLICAFSAVYAGCVVVEFAAWAQANPDVDLHRAMAFDSPAPGTGHETKQSDGQKSWRTPVYGSVLFGLGLGGLSVATRNLAAPCPQFCRWLVVLSDSDAKVAMDIYAALPLCSVAAMLIGLLIMAASLNALAVPDPFLSARLAWNALVLFVTNPEANHPLAHHFRIPWLRPIAVRVTLTGLALIAIASGILPSSAPVAPRRQTTDEPKETVVFEPLARHPHWPVSNPLDPLARRTSEDLPPAVTWRQVYVVGSSRVDLQACKLEYSIVSPK